MTEPAAASPPAVPVLFGLALAFCVIWFANLDYRRLIKTDEGRYAEIAREMASSGDWVTPRSNGYKYLYKPPLQYWATAAAFTVFGENEWTARLWTALTGLFGVALVYVTGRKLWDPLTGAIAALVLGASLHWIAMGHVSSLDMGLAFFLSLSTCAFAIAQHDGATVRERRNWMILAWAGAALALMSKGLIGIVLPGGAVAAYLLWSRDWRLLTRLHLLPGIALFMASCVPWFVLVTLRNAEFFHFFFIHEHFERFLTKVHGRYQPAWYFIPILIAALVPWTLGLPAAVAAGVRKSATRFQPHRFLLVWAIVVFVFFSASSSKLPSYIAPILPALALLSARPLLLVSANALTWQWAPIGIVGAAIAAYAPLLVRHDRPDLPRELLAGYAPWIAAGGIALTLAALIGIALVRRGRRFAAIATMAAGGLGFGQCLLTGHEALSPVFSAYHIAQKIQSELGAMTDERTDATTDPITDANSGPDIPIFAVDTYDHTLPFYLRRTLIMVAYKDELAAAIGWEPEKFLPDYDAFERAWAAAPRAFALMAPREFDTFTARKLPMTVVVRDPRRVVVKKP